MPPLDISDDMGGGGVPPTASKTAGLVSGAHGSMYSYFERPITARDSSRVAPTVESKPADDPSPRRDPAAEAALRAEALEGAAGMQSNAVSTTAWLGAWLEADTPRNCRKLLPKDGAFDETKTNIFAPEAQPDEKQGEAVKSRIEEMRALRQRQESEALAAKIAAIETSGPVAGVATALAPPAQAVGAGAIDGAAPGRPPTPRAGEYVTEYTAASQMASADYRGHAAAHRAPRRLLRCRPPSACRARWRSRRSGSGG